MTRPIVHPLYISQESAFEAWHIDTELLVAMCARVYIVSAFCLRLIRREELLRNLCSMGLYMLEEVCECFLRFNHSWLEMAYQVLIESGSSSRGWRIFGLIFC